MTTHVRSCINSTSRTTETDKNKYILLPLRYVICITKKMPRLKNYESFNLLGILSLDMKTAHAKPLYMFWTTWELILL